VQVTQKTTTTKNLRRRRTEQGRPRRRHAQPEPTARRGGALARLAPQPPRTPAAGGRQVEPDGGERGRKRKQVTGDRACQGITIEDREMIQEEKYVAGPWKVA
jgi:hypothetical protein